MSIHFKRADRVAALIKEEVSKIILQELGDPQLGFLTITKVKCTDDFRHARIFYSVLGTPEKQNSATEALQRAHGHIRGEIGHRLNLRFVPTIQFIYDDSAEYAEHIEVLLKRLKSESPE
jgi:ribosome-binding factor A